MNTAPFAFLRFRALGVALTLTACGTDGNVGQGAVDTMAGDAPTAPDLGGRDDAGVDDAAEDDAAPPEDVQNADGRLIDDDAMDDDAPDEDAAVPEDIADTGPAPDADVAEDSGDPGAPPLEASPEAWTWIPVEGSFCGNGSTHGVAVNLTDRSDDVLIVLQGGGICWDWNTCFVVKSASHIEDTLTGPMVLGEIAQGAAILDRTNPANPFRDASVVFVPYCTGDFHAGDSVTTYTLGALSKTVHHVGARNWSALLPRLKATFPRPPRLWLTGFSAGGLGVTWNWWRFLEAFPESEVHALNDCGTPIEPTAGRFDAWKASVRFVPPPDCEDCLDGLPRLLAHYAATVPAPHRYALLAYRQDLVLQLFLGLGPEAIQNRTMGLRNAMGEFPRMKTYYLDGTAHVMMPQLQALRTSPGSGRVLALDWVHAWATGEGTWDHAGP